ncbi:MAG: twin-arginine translocase TatA/TatE family subunit [Phenylobacterium sp.]
MGSFSIWHWLIVLVIVAILFGGRGKLSNIMGDAAKGIRAFKDGLKGEEAETEEVVVSKPLPKTRAKDKASG